MRILLDENMCKLTAHVLSEAGHDVKRVVDSRPAAGDPVILVRAVEEEERILLTEDSDFGQLAVYGQAIHSGILEVPQVRPAVQALMCQLALETYGVELQQGALVILGADKVRIIPPAVGENA